MAERCGSFTVMKTCHRAVVANQRRVLLSSTRLLGSCFRSDERGRIVPGGGQFESGIDACWGIPWGRPRLGQRGAADSSGEHELAEPQNSQLGVQSGFFAHMVRPAELGLAMGVSWSVIFGCEDAFGKLERSFAGSATPRWRVPRSSGRPTGAVFGGRRLAPVRWLAAAGFSGGTGGGVLRYSAAAKGAQRPIRSPRSSR